MYFSLIVIAYSFGELKSSSKNSSRTLNLHPM